MQLWHNCFFTSVVQCQRCDRTKHCSIAASLNLWLWKIRSLEEEKRCVTSLQLPVGFHVKCLRSNCAWQIKTIKLRTEHRAFLSDICSFCSSNSPQIAVAASEQMFPLLSHVQVWFFRHWRCGREHPSGTSWHNVRSLAPFNCFHVSKHFKTFQTCRFLAFLAPACKARQARKPALRGMHIRHILWPFQRQAARIPDSYDSYGPTMSYTS